MVNSITGNSGNQQRQRLGWYLFDFSTSVLIINGGLYFPQWIVFKNSGGDFWFNLALPIMSIILICTAPLIGLIIDKRKNGMRVLYICGTVMFLATFLIRIFDKFTPSHKLHIIIGLACFVFLMYSYQMAIVFYNTLLGRVTSPENLSKTSGRGLASGWLGGVLGVPIIYLFVKGLVPYFQPPGISQAFLSTAIIYGILVSLSLFLLRGIETTAVELKQSATVLYKEAGHGLRELMRQRNIRLYLFAYLLFSDAMLTIQYNASIYLSVVMKLDDTGKAAQVMLLLITAAIGGLCSGVLTKKYGSRKTMVILLSIWPIVVLLISGVSNIVVFSILFSAVGFLFGATSSISRALFFLQIPQTKQNQSFALYSSSERFASIFGPLVWSATLYVFKPIGDERYRMAMLMMVPFLVLSALIFRRGTFREHPETQPIIMNQSHGPC